MLKSVLAGLCLVFMVASAQAGDQPNISRAWASPWAPSSQSDVTLRSLQAWQDYSLRHNPGSNAGGGSVTNNYLGTVNNTYTGPNSSTGSTVTNVQNLSEVNTTASGGSVVTTGVGQTATGGTQSGAANANAATMGNNGTFNTGSNQSPTSN